jgi:phage shock protein A
MTELIEPNTAAELETLRRVNAELLQKSATRKARIQELEASVGTLTAKTTEADTRIKALTVDAPLMEVCESISIAPGALRSALEAEYKIEMREGVLTLVNPANDKPVMGKDGKAVPFQGEAIKTLLLESKDAEKAKLYRAILIASKASGGAGAQLQRAVAPAPKHRFGLR